MNSDVEDFIQSLEESGANLPDNFPFSADGTDDEESDGRAPAINFQKLINSMPGTSEDRKDGKEKETGKREGAQVSRYLLSESDREGAFGRS